MVIDSTDSVFWLLARSLEHIDVIHETVSDPAEDANKVKL